MNATFGATSGSGWTASPNSPPNADRLAPARAPNRYLASAGAARHESRSTATANWVQIRMDPRFSNRGGQWTVTELATERGQVGAGARAESVLGERRGSKAREQEHRHGQLGADTHGSSLFQPGRAVDGPMEHASQPDPGVAGATAPEGSPRRLSCRLS